jgi:hypothetical protein
MSITPLSVAPIRRLGVMLLFAIVVSVIVHKWHSREMEIFVSPDSLSKKPAAQFIAVTLPPPPSLTMSTARPDAVWPLKLETTSVHTGSTREKMPVKPLRAQSVKPRSSPTVRPLNLAQDPKKARKTSNADSTGRAIGQSAKNSIGEKLLTRLETGDGPRIEIAWPARATERQQLFRLFHDCVGVRLARLQGKRIAAVEADNAYRAFSGYVRVINGATTLDEHTLLRNLDQPGIAVRLFPRSFDERLLTGLARLTGGDLRGMQHIRGSYTLRGNALTLAFISVDGKPVAGNILLADTRRCSVNSNIKY